MTSDAKESLARMLFGGSMMVAAGGGVPVPPGLGETLMGGFGLLNRLTGASRANADKALTRARSVIEAEWDAWGRRPHADAGAREGARAAFEAVAARVTLTPEQVGPRTSTRRRSRTRSWSEPPP